MNAVLSRRKIIDSPPAHLQTHERKYKKQIDPTDKTMIRNNLTIFFILIVSLGTFSCSSANKTAKSEAATKKMNEPTEESVQQTHILRVETEVYQKPGNPLPSRSDIDGTHLFTCEIKRENGETVQKQEQKINFTLGESHNEGILKFILPVPEKAHYVEVEHLDKHGAWVKIYSEIL